MEFTEGELEYLRTQPLARVATVSSDGQPDVSPVGFRFDGEQVWIMGRDIAKTYKYKNVQAGNEFSFPNCAPNFIGDYNGITVDSNGVGHALWTDIRTDQFDPPNNADQDPFTATLSASG